MAPEPDKANTADGWAGLAEGCWRQRAGWERDLHDGPSLRLSALSLRLGVLQHMATDAEVRAGLRAAQVEVGAVVGELRGLAGKLYPPLLEESGLGPALRQVAEHAGTWVDVVDTPDRFGVAVEGAVYFAVADHVAAAPSGRRVEVVIRRDEHGLLLTIRGLDPDSCAALHDSARSLGLTVTTASTLATGHALGGVLADGDTDPSTPEQLVIAARTLCE